MCLVSASATVIYRQPCDVWQIGAIVNQSITHACAPLSITGHTTGLYATATVACVSVSPCMSRPWCWYIVALLCVCVLCCGVVLSSGFWGIWRVGLPGGLLAYPRLAFVQHASFRQVVAHYPATGVHVVGTAGTP